MKKGTFKRTRRPRARTAEEAKEEFQRRVRRGIAVQMQKPREGKVNIPYWHEPVEDVVYTMVEKGEEEIRSAQKWVEEDMWGRKLQLEGDSSRRVREEEERKRREEEEKMESEGEMEEVTSESEGEMEGERGK